MPTYHSDHRVDLARASPHPEQEPLTNLPSTQLAHKLFFSSLFFGLIWPHSMNECMHCPEIGAADSQTRFLYGVFDVFGGTSLPGTSSLHTKRGRFFSEEGGGETDYPVLI